MAKYYKKRGRKSMKRKSYKKSYKKSSYRKGGINKYRRNSIKKISAKEAYKATQKLKTQFLRPIQTLNIFKQDPSQIDEESNYTFLNAKERYVIVWRPFNVNYQSQVAYQYNKVTTRTILIEGNESIITFKKHQLDPREEIPEKITILNHHSEIRFKCELVENPIKKFLWYKIQPTRKCLEYHRTKFYDWNTDISIMAQTSQFIQFLKSVGFRTEIDQTIGFDTALKDYFNIISYGTYGEKFPNILQGRFRLNQGSSSASGLSTLNVTEQHRDLTFEDIFKTDSNMKNTLIKDEFQENQIGILESDRDVKYIGDSDMLRHTFFVFIPFVQEDHQIFDNSSDGRLKDTDILFRLTLWNQSITYQ